MGIDEMQKSSAAGAQAVDHAAERMQRLEFRKMTEQLARSNQVDTDGRFSKMVDKSVFDRGMNILSQAVSVFAKSSIGKLFLKEKDLLRELSKKDGKYADFSSDKVELNNQEVVPHVADVAKRRQITRELRETYNKMDTESKSMLREYSQTYARVVTTGAPIVSDELNRLEKRLKDKGITNNHLFEMRLMVKNSIRGAVVNQIKDAFLKRMLSTDMIVEWHTAGRGLNELLQSIIGNEQMGGADFGGYRSGLQGTVDQIKDDLSRELRLSLKELLDQKNTERLIGEKVDPETVKKELKSYLQAASRVGFDVKEYLQTWGKHYVDQGLFPFMPPEEALNVAAQMSQQQQRDQQNSEDLDLAHEPEEKTEDYLIAALRAAYLRSALGGGWRASLFAKYKIRQLKNKMIKLGIYFEELNEKVQREAELIAATKIIEMLHEALVERATLYKLAGPAYRMVEAKVTSLMKNAQTLNMDISEYDFNLLRDKANHLVFDVAKRELHLTMLSLSVKDSPPMRDKKKKLVMLLERIKAESDIQESIGLQENDMTDRIKLSA